MTVVYSYIHYFFIEVSKLILNGLLVIYNKQKE